MSNRTRVGRLAYAVSCAIAAVSLLGPASAQTVARPGGEAAAGTGAQSTAPGEVRGRVVHATTGQPVKAPVVLLEEYPTAIASVDADGRFAFPNVPAGHYHLLVTALGFVPLRVEVQVPGLARPLEVALNPELHYSEVVSVTGSARDQFVAYEPTSVLAGQDLAIRSEGSLGAALKSQPGIAERSFGPAPSRPVIRGLDGDRVLILEDGRRTGDLSSQSGDHGVSVNPAAATRLEVVRGPAALLYGANAIGGIVNVVSEQIPRKASPGVSGTAQADFGTAATDGGGAADVQVGNGPWAFRAGGSARTSGDMGTPEGEIANTQSRMALGDIALSFTGEKGYLGAGYGYQDSRYGVPVIEEGQVELTPRRHAVTLRGERRDMTGFFSGIRSSLAYRNYRHDELVAGDPETTFRNDSTELDVLANHRQYGRLKGTFGGWGLLRAFESSGAEALSPPVDQRCLALFLFEELTWPHVTVQFGGRFDRSSFNVKDDTLPDRDFSEPSVSLGMLFRPSDSTTIAVSLARASRHPALEELYYFGPHPGNYAFEIGNANLVPEKAFGLDLSFRWRLSRASGEVTYFRNDISDYIFRQPISEEEFDERFGELEPGGDHGGHAHGDFPIVEYVGADSLLQGIEAHVDLDVTKALVAEIAMDYVRGELRDQGEALPRMPPFRFIGGLRYRAGAFQAGGDVTLVADQDRVYPGETPTDGYGLLRLFGAWSFQAGGVTNTITARLDNATNELYRNHLSLIKDYVVEMGRSFKVVYSLQF